MKLLVVEDEARIAALLETGLAAHGYTVDWAKTGAEALKLGMAPDVRRKLGETVIETVRGAGYRLRAAGSSTGPATP